MPHDQRRKRAARTLCHSLYEDREGNLWIGLVNGVSKLMSMHAESFTEQEGLPSDNIYSVLP